MKQLVFYVSIAFATGFCLSTLFVTAKLRDDLARERKHSASLLEVIDIQEYKLRASAVSNPATNYIKLDLDKIFYKP